MADSIKVKQTLLQVFNKNISSKIVKAFFYIGEEYLYRYDAKSVLQHHEGKLGLSPRF